MYAGKEGRRELRKWSPVFGKKYRKRITLFLERRDSGNKSILASNRKRHFRRRRAGSTCTRAERASRAVSEVLPDTRVPAEGKSSTIRVLESQKWVAHKRKGSSVDPTFFWRKDSRFHTGKLISEVALNLERHWFQGNRRELSYFKEADAFGSGKVSFLSYKEPLQINTRVKLWDDEFWWIKENLWCVRIPKNEKSDAI